MTDETKKPDELGGLWHRSGKKGQYMTGTLVINGTAHEIVCFYNDRKVNEKQPDWRVYKSKPKAAV